jgi:pilus assembly protein Flp/PilA
MKKGKMSMKKFFFNFLNSGRGTTSIEYAIIASLVAVAIIAAVANIGASVTALFAQVANSYPK